MLQILDVSLWCESYCTSIQSQRFYKWLWILHWSKLILYSSIHSNSNFAYYFDFDCLPILRKISICRRCFFFFFFFWCELQCKFSIYTLKSDQWTWWITIWWAKFELVCTRAINIHLPCLLQCKLQSHLQKRGLWTPVHQNLFRRKTV